MGIESEHIPSSSVNFTSESLAMRDMSFDEWILKLSLSAII